ncbi:MAG: DNA mismatch repair endonuclease MutL [Phycisphaerales bacterium]|nr:DNA mismatch repair endonuclease MutL [Phycisphaerales bacterium]
MPLPATPTSSPLAAAPAAPTGTAPSRRIRVMSSLVASTIAAGEVVERPASVVKELVENAIDAGATRISIDLEQGGIELVRITDDGHGIPEADLHLALAPHATSKITATEDLDQIATLGFRGEALASITSVSRITLRSRTLAQPAAAEVSAEGDQVSPPRPSSGPLGTSITVRNLFFNTPARRKFLRTPSTEQGRCVEVVRQLAMSHPALGFQLTTDGRTSLDLPPGQTPTARCLDILGTELASELIETAIDPALNSPLASRSNVSVWALVGRPSLARATAAGQFIFVNGRAVRDRTLQHAVKEAYRGLIEPGRYPTCVVMIDLPPTAVDVNVHPAKAEVRFRDSSSVHQTVLHTIRRALQSADLTPSVGSGSSSWSGGVGGAGSGFNASPHAGIAPDAAAGASGLLPASPFQSPARVVNPAAFAEHFRRVMPGAPQWKVDFSDLRAATSGASPAGTASGEAFGQSSSASAPHGSPGVGANADAAFGNAAAAPLGTGAATSGAAASAGGGGLQPGDLLDASPTSPALQIHNSFLVTQDQQGILIIDQHALHERVMFEKLLARLQMGSGPSADPSLPIDGARASGTLESQRMLVPAVIEASPRQVEALDSLRPLLKRLGIEAEPMGPTSIAIHAFSSFLFERNVDAAPFMAELLDRAIEESWGAAPQSPDAQCGAPLAEEAALHEVLDMMACKAAIKAGDRLSDLELSELLALRERIERASNCPHGRPTSIRLSIRELEKRFGRS